MDDYSIPLIIAAATALVGLLCLWLALVALRRLGKTKKGLGAPGDTPAELRSFARKQGLYAVVMFALAAIIVYNS